MELFAKDHSGYHSTGFWGSLYMIQYSKIPAHSTVSLPFIRVPQLLLLQLRKLVPNKELSKCGIEHQSRI